MVNYPSKKKSYTLHANKPLKHAQETDMQMKFLSAAPERIFLSQAYGTPKPWITLCKIHILCFV